MSRFEPFWDYICERREYLWLLLMALLFFLILTSFTFVFGEPGSESWVVAQLNVIIILATGAVAGGMYWKCVKRARKRY